jgi:chemotaxis protein methyltransferase CheR
LYERGRYAEASDTIAGMLSDHPGDARAMVLLARVYANQGRLGDAIEWCRRAIAADKLNAGYHYLLAVILQEDSRAEETVDSLRRALYLDPNFVLAHFTLGSLARRQGRLKESAKHFENALSLLDARPSDEILPESDAMTAGRLRDIIRVTAVEETVV